MKFSSCRWLLLCLSFPVFSQKLPFKFGNVPIEAMQMTSYDKDTSAVAVFLGDYGVSSMRATNDRGLLLDFERTARIKILKKEGLQWGNFEIMLYQSGGTDEKLSGLKAVTYNLEAGKIVESKAKGESVFKEKVNENYNLTKIAFPSVRVGSVLEITYKISSEFLANLHDWQFQYEIPVVWSEYRTIIPDFFIYEKYLQGYLSPTINENGRSANDGYSDVTQRIVLEDVPGFLEEPFMTTTKDYVSQMNYELATVQIPNQTVKNYVGTWVDLHKSFLESNDFYGQITGNNFLGKVVEGITSDANGDDAKIAAISNYVKNNVKWDGTSRKFAGSSLKKVLEEKTGSSAEINLLLGSMLEKAGYSVSPVLVSTRDHGFVRETIAVSTQFNYVICLLKVGDRTMLMDATDGLLPTGVLPERCLNGNGFVVAKEGFSWVPLKTPGKSRTAVSADFKINSDGGLQGKLSIDRTGYHAQASRKKYFAKGEEEYLKEFFKARAWEVSKSEVKNAKEISEPLKETHELLVSQHADMSGDIMYINPFLMLREDENPFKLELRQYPVDYGSALEKMYLARLTLPEGYEIEEMPQARVVALPENAAKFTFNASLAGNTLVITSIFQINRNIFIQDQYPALREFYNAVVAKQAEQIVLKKKL